MKSSLMMRILLSTLIPVFLVFIIVTSTIQGIISTTDEAHIAESIKFDTKQILSQTSTKLKTVEMLLSEMSYGMASIDINSEDLEIITDSYLRSLFSSSTVVYAAWVGYEPEVIGTEERMCRFFVREGGKNVDSFKSMNFLVLDTLELPAWYGEPLHTGRPRIALTGKFDYRIGTPLRHIVEISYPIIQNRRVIGCVGIDILYESLINTESDFSVDALAEIENTASADEQVMLLSTSGEILYSKNHDEIGMMLFDSEAYNAKITDDPSAVLDIMSKSGIWLDETNASAGGTRYISILHPFQVLENLNELCYIYRQVPLTQSYRLFYPSMEIIYMTVGLGLILLCLITFFSTRGLVRPIKSITNSFHIVSESETDFMMSTSSIPVTPTGVSELVILQKALTKMMTRLKEIHDLKLKSVEAAVENEKLLAANEAKTNFFANMSHEIRTPMNAISGISDIILEEGGLTLEQEKHITDIKISSDALLVIINDIMDISKMETEKMSLQSENYNFKLLIDNIASITSHLAEKSGLSFTLEIDGNFPQYLYGDPYRMRQVIMNLLGNAIKYTQKGFISLKITAVNEMLCFDVSDSGIGIRQEDLDTIFDSFKRVDSRRNREINGTGLGLAIVKNMTELMGGSIGVVSDYGVGSTFSVRLPLILGTNVNLPQYKSDKNVKFTDDLRVLVVDDNAINLNVSSGLLRVLHEIESDVASSGAEAIEMVQNTKYDIVFMDHMMPIMDGVDTTRYIRALGGEYEDLPIIALTANAVIGTREELMGAGLDDFLTKPIQHDRLREILYTWVPKEKQIAENTYETPQDEQILSAGKPRFSSSYVSPPYATLSNIAERIKSPLLHRVLELEEINLTVGLENISYEESMYAQSLRLLSQAIPDTVSKLRDIMENKDLNSFKIAAHGIKGALSSLGAMELASLALSLELSSSRNNLEECTSALPEFAQKLEQLNLRLDEIFSAEKESAYSSSGEVSPEAAKEQLRELCKTLQTYDYEAITDSLQSVTLTKWPPETEEVLNRVKTLAERFDYAAAIELIERELL